MPAFVIYVHRGQFSSVNNMKKKNFAVDTFNGWSLNSIVDGILMGCTLSFWLHFNYDRASDAANWISEWANEEHLIIFAVQITMNIRVCSWWFQFYSFLPSGITVVRRGFVDSPIRESFEWWWSSKEPARLDKILNLKLAEPIEDFCFEASNINSLHFNFESRLGILYLAELQLDKLLWLDKF